MDGANYSNIEGCEEKSMFTVNHSVISSDMTSIGHLVAEEGEICSSAIGNEEDESLRRNVWPITNHFSITSV